MESCLQALVLPAIRDHPREEAQVLVDLHTVMDSEDFLLVVLENGKSVAKNHLGG